MFWAFVLMFFAVIGVKYYTAIQSRNLERRLHRVKRMQGIKKNEYEKAELKNKQIKKEEEAHIERLRKLKELIQDLHLRMNAQEARQDNEIEDAYKNRKQR